MSRPPAPSCAAALNCWSSCAPPSPPHPLRPPANFERGTTSPVVSRSKFVVEVGVFGALLGLLLGDGLPRLGLGLGRRVALVGLGAGGDRGTGAASTGAGRRPTGGAGGAVLLTE